MGNSRESRASAEDMKNMHPIDRIMVLTSGQVKRQDLESIEVGDIKITEPDGTLVEIAGVTFNNRRNDAQA